MEPVSLLSLWLPILVSSVIVFFASYLAWMVLPHHRSDFAKLEDEDGVRAVLRGTPPGEYSFPNATSSKEWNSPEWKKKAEEGPNGFLTVLPDGVPNLGKRLFCWFLYLIAVSIFVAYVTSRGLAGVADPHYLKVFRLAGTVAFLAYSMAHFSGAIWQGHGWSRTFKDVLDGLIYGLLTAGTFGWLWPS